jgi:hypothetical protein
MGFARAGAGASRRTASASIRALPGRKRRVIGEVRDLIGAARGDPASASGTVTSAVLPSYRQRFAAVKRGPGGPTRLTASVRHRTETFEQRRPIVRALNGQDRGPARRCKSSAATPFPGAEETPRKSGPHAPTNRSRCDRSAAFAGAAVCRQRARGGATHESARRWQRCGR